LNPDALDAAMQSLLKRHGFPGGALGIAQGGKVVYAKGFGVADRENGTPVTADSRFRLASLSKSFTAMAVLRLIEKGKLQLNDKVLPQLALQPLTGSLTDERWQQITIRHLLLHTGGWVKAKSGDAMFKSTQICAEAGTRGPADADLTIRWMLSRRLDAAPGTTYSYCNFGYVLLGRIIAQVTGRSYESAMQDLVFRRCDADGMALGHSLRSLRNEVRYYHHDRSLGPSVYPELPPQVPWPYGTFALESNAANGGWVGSVKDVLAFLTSLDENARKPLLPRQSLQSISQNLAPGSGAGTGAQHGLGWLVRPRGEGGRPNLWYIGGLPGTKAIMVRLGNGFDWVALFNLRPAALDSVNLDIQNTIYAAANK
jgi:CubicO group peptidase (beta-lactamase class C family)